MNKLVGSNVDIHIKLDNEIVSGVIFDIDDEYVYIQQSASAVITIPRENIKYYASNNIGTIINAQTPIAKVDSSSITGQFLKVFVDKDLIAEIDAHNRADLSKYNADIMSLALSNAAVADCLSGRMQVSGEYIDGRLYIETSTSASESMLLQDSPNSISMSGSWENNFLSPTETALRLNNSVHKKSLGGANE